jgi:alpha-1,2-mannosyltransferase
VTRLLPTGPDRWWKILLVTAVLTALLLPMTWKHLFVDLKVYRLGGQALIDGIPLYHAKLADTIMQFTYPPFAAVLMVPFAVMPFPVSVAVWTLGTVAALVAVWRLSLTDRLRGRRPHPAALPALVVGSTLMEPVRETLGYGQINVILCAVVLYDLLRTEGRPARGIWLGVAAGLKLTPLVFFGVLFVNRQWRALAHACLGFAGTVLIGFLVIPSAAKEYWTETVRDTQRIGGLTYTGNQSINGLLARIEQNPAGGGTLWMALVVVVIGACLLASRLLWQRGQRVAAVSSCALIGLFCSPVS